MLDFKLEKGSGDKMDKILLIGGAPTSGKSYTTRKISEKLKLPWISTDTVRDQMMKIVSKNKYPHLFMHENATHKDAVKFHNKTTNSKHIMLHNKENQDVFKGVKAIIETDYSWESFIAEGVAILPKFVSKLKTDKKIIPVFLYDNNESRIRKTIFTRGLWDDARKYPDSVKEKEVQFVLKYNEYFRKEARKYKFKIVEIKNRKDIVNQILRIYD